MESRPARVNQVRLKIVLVRLETAKATELLRNSHQHFDPAMHDEGYILMADGNTTYDIAATGAGALLRRANHRTIDRWQWLGGQFS